MVSSAVIYSKGMTSHHVGLKTIWNKLETFGVRMIHGGWSEESNQINIKTYDGKSRQLSLDY